jgi:acetyl esterase/lipase
MELTPTWCLSETRKCLSEGARKFVIRKPEHETVADKQFGLNPDIPVTRQTPPTFLLQAEDDHVDNVNDSLAYYIALKKAGVPVEMHLYAQGGHAFGLRRTKLPVTGWPQLVETWLGTIGMIPERFAFEAQCPLPGLGPRGFSGNRG